MEAAGQIDTKDLAKAALEETEKFLEALRTEEQHPLRLWLRDKAEELLLELEASPDQAQRMEAWKEELFQAVPVQEVLLQLLRLLRSPVGPKAELEALKAELQALRDGIPGGSTAQPARMPRAKASRIDIS